MRFVLVSNVIATMHIQASISTRVIKKLTYRIYVLKSSYTTKKICLEGNIFSLTLKGIGEYP